MGPNKNKEKTYYLNYCEKYCNNITYTTILTPNFIICQLVQLLVFNDEWWVHWAKIVHHSWLHTHKEEVEEANSDIRCAIGCIFRITNYCAYIIIHFKVVFYFLFIFFQI